MTTKKPMAPSGRMKVGAEALQGLERFALDAPSLPPSATRGLYSFSKGGLQYDFIFSPSSHGRLFVFLSGYADRDRLTPPVFQRWSWARAFPGHCLFVADPSLRLDPGMGIAWYVGTAESPVVPTLVELIQAVATELRVPLNRVISYASSGGAFGALQLALALPEVTTVAINPQTVVTSYENRNVELFLRVCLGMSSRQAALAAYTERLSLLARAEELGRRRIVYAQNRLDTHHFDMHFAPLMKAMGMDWEATPRRDDVEVILFDHEGGHAPAEPRELVPTLIERAISLSESPSRAVER